MKARMTTGLVLLVLVTLTACDDSGRRAATADRANAEYRAAMDDYAAGHLADSARRFAQIVRNEPANAEARFQLACLQMDASHDYLAAFCNYTEYLQQRPDSDKAQVARDRVGRCERELAKALAEKFGLTNNRAQGEEMARLAEQIKAAETSRDRMENDLGEAMGRIAALRRENERLLKTLRNDVEEGAPVAERPSKRDIRALLEEDADETDRIKASEDVAALRAEEKSEREAGGTSLLPEQTAAAKATRDAARDAREEKARVERDAAAMEKAARPPKYVVQEGDTLILIAKRFYGRPQAWKKIRDANKAIISTDGRVRRGQVIALP